MENKLSSSHSCTPTFAQPYILFIIWKMVQHLQIYYLNNLLPSLLPTLNHKISLYVEDFFEIQ